MNPISTKRNPGNRGRSWSPTFEVVFVVASANSEQTRLGRYGVSSGHEETPGGLFNSPPVQGGGRVLEHGHQTAHSFPLSGLVWLRATRP